MRAGRALIVAVLFAGALAAVPSAASGACPRGAQCATLTVPLDHTGQTAGTQSVAYAKLPATGARTGTLVLLSGGPGQAAIPLTTGFAELVEPLRASYDIVTVDQRGTGDSGAIECDAESVSECAERLGNRRAFLNTPETARDLEDLRAALGVEQLTLFGVSYGAKVASEYARRYPTRVAAAILDSPAPVDGLDGVGELRALGSPRVLNEVCFPGLCERTVTDADAALAAAAERLQDGAVRGPLVSSTGGVRTVRVEESDLYSVLAASDLSPSLRAGLPAAVASLAEGDAAPLLHLTEVLSSGESGDGPEVNTARLLATTCIEARLPWSPDSAVATRADALRAYAAERASVFAPFRAETVLSSTSAGLCASWPPTPRPEPVAYQGPVVPVLVLAGREDLRTPLEDARRTALAVSEREGARRAHRRPFSADRRTSPAARAPGCWRSCAVARCSSARSAAAASRSTSRRRRTRRRRSRICGRRGWVGCVAAR